MRFMDEQERLIAEQAVLRYREVKAAADAAPFGHGLEAIERAALEGSRELGRRMVETGLRAAAAQKARATAAAAGGPGTSSGTASGG